MVPDVPWAPCIPQFIMIIYTLIRRPYNYFVDNLRSCFNFMVMMAITSMKVFIFNVAGQKAERTFVNEVTIADDEDNDACSVSLQEPTGIAVDNR